MKQVSERLTDYLFEFEEDFEGHLKDHIQVVKGKLSLTEKLKNLNTNSRDRSSFFNRIPTASNSRSRNSNGRKIEKKNNVATGFFAKNSRSDLRGKRFHSDNHAPFSSKYDLVQKKSLTHSNSKAKQEFNQTK